MVDNCPYTSIEFAQEVNQTISRGTIRGATPITQDIDGDTFWIVMRLRDDLAVREIEQAAGAAARVAPGFDPVMFVEDRINRAFENLRTTPIVVTDR